MMSREVSVIDFLKSREMILVNQIREKTTSVMEYETQTAIWKRELGQHRGALIEIRTMMTQMNVKPTESVPEEPISEDAPEVDEEEEVE